MIKIEDFYLDNILIDEKSYEKFTAFIKFIKHKVSYKILIDANRWIY